SRERRGVELKLLLFREDVTVNGVGRRRGLEDEAGIGTHILKTSAANLVEIAYENRRLAGALELDETPGADRGSTRRVDAEDGQIGHVAHLAIFEVSAGRELRGRDRAGEAQVLGQHLQFQDRYGSLVAASLSDPAPQHLIGRFAGPQAGSSLVGDTAGPL